MVVHLQHAPGTRREKRTGKRGCWWSVVKHYLLHILQWCALGGLGASPAYCRGGGHVCIIYSFLDYCTQEHRLATAYYCSQPIQQTMIYSTLITWLLSRTGKNVLQKMHAYGIDTCTFTTICSTITYTCGRLSIHVSPLMGQSSVPVDTQGDENKKNSTF